MKQDAEAKCGPVLAAEGDPRITKFGRFMRATRLDELPQLFNVLKGEMSIVGPRPERPFFVKQFIAQKPEYDYRHNVKPGITGLAQIAGKYNTSAYDKLIYDLLYIQDFSVKTDLMIMLQTFKVLLTKAVLKEYRESDGAEEKSSFVATVVKTHINTFHLPFLKMFKEYGWEVHVAAKNDFVDEPCVIPNCDRHFDIDFARSPFSKSNIKAYKQLKQIIETNHYDIIHCHTRLQGC